MKIINREEFLQLPAQTLFHKYEPDVYGELQIKVCNPSDGWHDDFVVDYLFGFVGGLEWYEEVEINKEFKFDGSIQRDGLYNKNQLFAVYDNQDIESLMTKLTACLK